MQARVVLRTLIWIGRATWTPLSILGCHFSSKRPMLFLGPHLQLTTVCILRVWSSQRVSWTWKRHRRSMSKMSSQEWRAWYLKNSIKSTTRLAKVPSICWRKAYSSLHHNWPEPLLDFLCTSSKWITHPKSLSREHLQRLPGPQWPRVPFSILTQN